MIKQYLEQLLKMSNQQKEYIYNDDYEMFNDLVEKKEKIFEKLLEERKKAERELTDEEKELVNELLKIDKVNRKEYDRQFEEVRKTLKEMKQLKERQHKYNNPYADEMMLGRRYDNEGI